MTEFTEYEGGPIYMEAAYAIGAGLRDRTVLPAVGGLVAGYVALTVVVAAGVAALVARSPMVLTAVRAVAAAVPDLGGPLEHEGDERRARPHPRAEAIEPVLDEIRPVAAERPPLAEVLAEIEERVMAPEDTAPCRLVLVGPSGGSDRQPVHRQP
ncbi:hypothetical protein GCM10010464_54630 [Pseudonocardia yunnanensis]|uniref:Uncharacterized protein n=1 Tax=Pseudonocardia yunnanensis TaxID=58107 RepID=A0ABW4FA87_9PSEU